MILTIQVKFLAESIIKAKLSKKSKDIFKLAFNTINKTGDLL